MNERAFSFLRVNKRESKQRTRGITEIRGPYYMMFEDADPEVFAWYIKNYEAEVNLFVDHSQIVQLECLRSGLWGTKSLWGRVVTCKGTFEEAEESRERTS
jgi:(2R)-phospho-3-sulfolactate synthase (ComA)